MPSPPRVSTYATRTSIVVVGIVAAAFAAARAQEPAAADLLKDAAVKAALDAAKANEPQTIEDQVRFCEVPAPSFKETGRGDLLKQTFQQLGLQNVRVDKAGNVLGDRPGAAPRPRFVIAAHLDTVFPEGTDVTVKREGAVLRGPGIGDDCRGLAVLVAIIRALKQANVQTPGSITFVADVGEEGLGDLRGMKQLFNDTMKGQIDRFVSIDGTGVSITNVAVGSHRYRVTFKGPGGHSFGAFGLANPIGAMGRAIAKISDLQVPRQPKTTFNVGRVGGGTSVNSIPFDGWMEVDMRSSDPASLAAIDAGFHKAVDSAVVEENERWGTPRMDGDERSRRRSARRVHARKRAHRADDAGSQSGPWLRRDTGGRIDGLESADEPQDSGGDDRRRRARHRRTFAGRGVRRHRLVARHATSGVADGRSRAEVINILLLT